MIYYTAKLTDTLSQTITVWKSEIMQVKYPTEHLAHRGDQKVELLSQVPRVDAWTTN